MLSLIKYQARATIRRGLLTGIGAILSAVGIGFLTHGAWLYLETTYSTQIASYVVGGAFIFVGLAVVMLSKRRRRPAKAPMPPATQNVALVEAFLVGMDAGKSRGRGRG